MLNGQVLVVGGGIAGIFSALYAQKRGRKVVLVERASECGGLLRSKMTETGLFFDYGTHIPALFFDETIDGLLFSDHDSLDWIKIKKLKKGNYFNGTLNTFSQFLNIKNLPESQYNKALSEIINSAEDIENPKSLEEALLNKFGEFLTNYVYKPLLKKIYENKISNLSPNAHKFMEYVRVVVSDSRISKELKKSEFYDSRIAYANSEDGVSESIHLYPRVGGSGAWIKALVNQFERNGGVLLTNVNVETVDVKCNRAGLNDGKILEFDKLIWASPIAILYRMIGSDSAMKRPRFVPTTLHHFLLTERPVCDRHYIYVNDSSMHAFRVTFYSNLTGDSNDSRLTVEAVHSLDGKTIPSGNDILVELKKMGVVSDRCQFQQYYFENLENGFPEITVEDIDTNKRMLNDILRYENIVVGGRGAENAFFMNDVIKHLMRELRDKL